MWNKLKQLKDVPGLRELYKLWMLFAKALGFVMSRIIFTLIYLFAIGAYALALRLVKMLKGAPPSRSSYWLRKPEELPTLESLRKPF